MLWKLISIFVTHILTLSVISTQLDFALTCKLVNPKVQQSIDQF